MKLMTNCKYQEVSYADVSHHLKNDILLIITATDIETGATHKKLTPFPEFTAILKMFEGSLTYFVGLFGAYRAVHVQCTLGSTSRASSILTATEAIKLLNPKVVLMPGIAFGIDSDSQKIGDVIVAETIYPYNLKRIGEKVIQRGTPLTASKVLVNRFKNAKLNWEHLLKDGKKSELIVGAIISGEELIDNKEYRDNLVAQFPSAKGGEMEGNGLYAACDGEVQYILVKGICDFADGLKSVDKDQNQQIAIAAALAVCLEVFSSTTAFNNIGLNPINYRSQSNEKYRLDINDLLFDIYDENKEEYYIERKIDGDFASLIDYNCVWIHGTCGCGKSNYILRNLAKKSSDFFYISLASCVGQSVDNFFIEILYDLTANLEEETNQIQPRNFVECSSRLLNLIEKHHKDKPYILFIEEIPVSNAQQEQEFAEKVFSLIINKNLKQGLQEFKFVLSSINDPQRNIQLFNHKIKSFLKFLKLTNWDKSDTTSLIDLIISHLKIPFNDTLKQNLIDKSKGSPRFIKKYFRNLLSEANFDDVNMAAMILKTEIELSQI